MGIDANMVVGFKREITEQEYDHGSYIFGCAFHDELNLSNDERPLVMGSKFYGDAIKHLFGFKTLLTVPTWARWYSPDYARGPLMRFVAWAELLEQIFPDGTVLYFDDTYGPTTESVFDREARVKLMKFFAQSANDSYRKYFSGDHTTYICPICKVGMTQSGFGANFSYHFCAGCGWSRKVKNGIEQVGRDL